MNLREELLAIRQEAGALTPQIVLDAARAEDHPLHDRFEWDDSAAAERWRVHQAHVLIRSVKIKLPSGDVIEPVSVRAFQAVRTNDERTFVYDPSEEVAADPLRLAMVLRDMERDWKLLRARYGAFEQFSQMIQRDLDVA